LIGKEKFPIGNGGRTGQTGNSALADLFSGLEVECHNFVRIVA